MTMATQQEIIQMTREAQRTSLPVRAARALLWPGSPPVLPVAWLETGLRPDVSDLIRVHKYEGSGDITTHWLYTWDSYFLHCELKRPVGALFWLAFPIPQFRNFLTIAANTHVLAVVVTPPPRWALDGGEISCTSGRDETQNLLIEALTIELYHKELPSMLARDL